MATQIQKNTKKLVERKLDMLFAKQQELNGNKGSQDNPGDQPDQYAMGGHIGYAKAQSILKKGTIKGKKLSAKQQAYFESVQNDNLPQAGGGWDGTIPKYLNPNTPGYGVGNSGLSAMDVQSNWWNKLNSQINPIGLDNVDVTAQKNVPTISTVNTNNGTNLNNTPIRVGGPTPITRNLTAPNLGGTTSPGAQNLYNTLEGTPTLAGAPNPSGVPKAGSIPEGLTWGKAGTFAAQAAPMIYNLIKGLQKPDKVTPNYNPYEDKIRSLMANRRFNVEPLLTQNRTAQAVNNRNIYNTANSRGELMGNLGATQNYRMAGDAAAWAQKNNVDNQYVSEQAQMDANLGNNRAQMDWNVQTGNAQNKAATNQFLGQGFNDLSQFAQIQQLMGNQQNRDAQLASLYPDMYSQIYQFQPAMQQIIKAAGNVRGGK